MLLHYLVRCQVESNGIENFKATRLRYLGRGSNFVCATLQDMVAFPIHRRVNIISSISGIRVRPMVNWCARRAFCLKAMQNHFLSS